MNDAEIEPFRFRDDGVVSDPSTAAIITRVYDWMDSNDDSLNLSPVIQLKPAYDRPEYHNVIYSRIARGGDVNQRRREALLRLDLGLASLLDIPLSQNESTGVTSIGLSPFTQLLSDMLGLPIAVTVSDYGGGLLYTCAEEHIVLSSSDVSSCLLKRRELGAIPLHSIPSADIDSTATEHLPPSPIDETVPLAVGAAPDDHNEREATARHLLRYECIVNSALWFQFISLICRGFQMYS